MAKEVRISLANKCQLLFGAAVVLILTAALAVVWLRMQTLVEHIPQKRAADVARLWLNGQIDLGGPATPVRAEVEDLPSDVDMTLTLVEREDLPRLTEEDLFLDQAVDRFELRPQSTEWFGRTRDAEGDPYYRYARAIRQSDLARLRGKAAVALDAEAAVEPDPVELEDEQADPLQSVLLIHLRDREIAAQQTVNRIYIIAAGTFAGLLALGVFWFITTRLILSPVRLLRDVTAKVSEGDLNIRSDINTGDEFEELSDVFNTMLENLKEKQDQLRSINKSLDLKLGELAASNVTLYEANKVKGEFLANVSHELRTPLNSMIGFAEVLQETLPRTGDAQDEKRQRYVNNIITSSKRLLDLINDLLDLAKIEAGRLELNISSVNLSDTAEGLVHLIRPQANKRGVSVRMNLEPSVPTVRTDAGKLQQILFNFLSNAVKFTPSGGVVTLGVTHIPPAHGGAQGRVRLSVSDTGPGIPPSDQERIFDKFTQLDPGETRSHGGTGLGLTISKELAEMLQGQIEVESDLGRGATFSVTIPVVLEKRSVPLMPEVAGGGAGPF